MLHVSPLPPTTADCKTFTRISLELPIPTGTMVIVLYIRTGRNLTYSARNKNKLAKAKRREFK